MNKPIAIHLPPFAGRTICRAFILLGAAMATLPLLAATEPYFAFSPAAVAPGGTVTVAGAGFALSSNGVAISAGTGAGVRTTLAITFLTNGTFTKTLALPASLTPGLYFINVVDSAMHAAMNLTGPLTVVPAGGPWFSFTPTAAAPGQAITITARRFDVTSAGAAAALLSGSGQATLLGTSPLSNGAFSKSFVIPPLGPNASFAPMVEDVLGKIAFNATGPLAVGPPASSVIVGFYPIAASVDTATNRVYVANGGTDSTAVLDAASNTLIASIPVGALPCASGVNSSTNSIYIANINSDNVSVIDGAADVVVATVPVGKAPCAITVNPQTNRIFVGNYSDNTLSVLDGSTNSVVATIPMPFPAGLGINTVTNRVYSANGFSSSISVIDGSTNAVLAVIPVGAVPDAIGVNETTNRVYVGNFFGRSVTVIDGNTNSVITTIPAGIGPAAVTIDPGTNRIYVANYMSASVSVIDGATNAVAETIPVGRIPEGAAFNPLTKTVYIANSGSNTVSLIRE